MFTLGSINQYLVRRSRQCFKHRTESDGIQMEYEEIKISLYNVCIILYAAIPKDLGRICNYK